MNMHPRPSDDELPICANCRKRTGTIRWGNALAQTHGFCQFWCKVCVYSTQLDHARERASMIPALEQGLADALAEDG